ncbi:MAG: NAD(+)/NADH kinase [Anaerolineales bacterium]|jgi:NAD+ kinase
MEATKEPFENIAVLAHPQIPAAMAKVSEVTRYLESHGAKTAGGALNDEALRQQVQEEVFDLVLVLGGDGTVLRAGHLCAPYNIPILAINMGSFGFLIEVAEDACKQYIDQLMRGEYWFECRMMLNTKIWRGEDCLGDWEVLNDTVIARGDELRPVHLSASLDGQAVTTYVADALIVATPTGSTAYSLAAGGPILPPELRNILLMPVAPHLSIDRGIVLAEGSTVVVTVLSDRQVVASGDGQFHLTLERGDRVEVKASKYTLSFVRFQEVGYFYRTLVSLMDQHPSVGVIK